MSYHGALSNSIEDQLCMAALHYLRSHFEEATEIYKKLLIENKDYHAINIYVALCYYKMDYYDVSLGLLFNQRYCYNFILLYGSIFYEEI